MRIHQKILNAVDDEVCVAIAACLESLAGNPELERLFNRCKDMMPSATRFHRHIKLKRSMFVLYLTVHSLP